MRIQEEEWGRFIPGVRMYKGKLTYFYNGEELWDYENGLPLIYDHEEREKWKVIIILPGVEVIPKETFDDCRNIETVIMKICEGAFLGCEKLIILSVPRHSTLGDNVIYRTAILEASPFEIDKYEYGNYHPKPYYDPRHITLGSWMIGKKALLEGSHFETNHREYNNYDVSNDEVNEWIQNLNQAEEFALHRECASIEPPSEDDMYEIIKQRGLPSIQVKNQVGLTALEYLQKNPYANINEQKLINRLVLDLMGGIIT